MGGKKTVLKRTWKDRGFKSEAQEKAAERLLGCDMETIERKLGEGVLFVGMSDKKPEFCKPVGLGNGWYKVKRSKGRE